MEKGLDVRYVVGGKLRVEWAMSMRKGGSIKVFEGEIRKRRGFRDRDEVGLANAGEASNDRGFLVYPAHDGNFGVWEESWCCEGLGPTVRSGARKNACYNGITPRV